MTLAMAKAHEGPVQFGQNPAVGAANSELVQRGLAKLEWLVVRDFAMTETADFWQKGSLISKGEFSPQDIRTEVFFFPAAMAAEKEGSVTNTSRLVQWHDKVCTPPGDSRSDLWFMYHLGKRLKELSARVASRATLQFRPSPGNIPLVATSRSRTRRWCCAKSTATRSQIGSSSKAFSRSGTTARPPVAAGCIVVSFPGRHENRAPVAQARWPWRQRLAPRMGIHLAR